MEIIKFCNKHGDTIFAASEGKRPRCRKCQVEAVKKRRKMLKQKLVDFKGGKCENCGYDKCIDALDFHHTDPNQKDFTISRNRHIISWDKLKAEAEKCELLCANCHREVHSEECNMGH